MKVEASCPMATQKPISTISYNSEAFLKEKLDTWLEAHIIQAYQYVCHKGEDGDKDHIHCRIEPNKKLDPMDLTESLKEFVPGNDKPLCVRPWRPSKEEDWILYAVHDEKYLKIKYGGGEKGEKLPYKWQDIKVPESYDMEIAYIRAKSSLEHSTVNMATRLKGGEKPLDMVLQGENPYLVNSLFRLLSDTDYTRLQDELTSLNDRFNRLLEALSDKGIDVQINEKGDFEIYDRNGK